MRETSRMEQTIDLISHAALRELRAFTKRTGQPTTLDQMDVAPMEHVTEIEIDEEHVTITYNEKITHRYNAKEITRKEWSYKYNDDPEFVKAIGAVIELARKHVRDARPHGSRTHHPNRLNFCHGKVLPKHMRECSRPKEFQAEFIGFLWPQWRLAGPFAAVRSR